MLLLGPVGSPAFRLGRISSCTRLAHAQGRCAGGGASTNAGRRALRACLAPLPRHLSFSSWACADGQSTLAVVPVRWPSADRALFAGVARGLSWFLGLA